MYQFLRLGLFRNWQLPLHISCNVHSWYPVIISCMERSCGEERGPQPSAPAGICASSNLLAMWVSHTGSGSTSPRVNLSSWLIPTGAEMSLPCQALNKLKTCELNDYCCKPLGLGVVCYAAIDNCNSLQQKRAERCLEKSSLNLVTKGKQW